MLDLLLKGYACILMPSKREGQCVWFPGRDIKLFVNKRNSRLHWDATIPKRMVLKPIQNIFLFTKWGLGKGAVVQRMYLYPAVDSSGADHTLVHKKSSSKQKITSTDETSR